MSINLVNPFMKFASGGGGAGYTSTADSDGIAAGGITSAWNAITNVEGWDGTSYSAAPANIPASRGLFCARGNQDDAIGCGGFTSTSIGLAQTTTYGYTSSSWSTLAAMNQARSVGHGLGGNTQQAFTCAGQNGSGGTQLFDSEEYDGSANTWTTKATSTNGRQGSVGDGTNTDFIKCGGGDSSGAKSHEVELYDGSTWAIQSATSTHYPYTAYNYAMFAATTSATAIFGASTTSTGTGVIAKFDGTSWTDAGSTPLAPKYIGMGGDSTNAILAGEWQSGTGSAYYDGSSFSTTNSLIQGKSAFGFGAYSA